MGLHRGGALTETDDIRYPINTGKLTKVVRRNFEIMAVHKQLAFPSFQHTLGSTYHFLLHHLDQPTYWIVDCKMVNKASEKINE